VLNGFDLKIFPSSIRIVIWQGIESMEKSFGIRHA
jgi:hypothetical protein